MVIFIILVILLSPAYAKDYGVQGHMFDILEPDLLDQITSKLNELDGNGQLDHHNQVLQERALQAIRRPQPVRGISKTQTPRVFSYDPSLTVPYDLKDHKGQIFQKAGTRINPLQTVPMSKVLVFIDGDDTRQVSWAMENHDEQSSKIILVSGSPFDLMNEFDRPIYFDQEARLTSKLGILNVPAVVRQKGLMLEIEEIIP